MSDIPDVDQYREQCPSVATFDINFWRYCADSRNDRTIFNTTDFLNLSSRIEGAAILVSRRCVMVRLPATGPILDAPYKTPPGLNCKQIERRTSNIQHRMSNIDMAAKRRKKHKNKISGFVISMCYNEQKSKF
jgi:hypothetical protein